ncbi:zinc-type alcohol dehydrogenase-like protein PB24D3.08c [Favolaschia claudopus]|uniref:Zinc-type alcohol dehydrogenase-like protein PB24D3.08c n=1 Tax=Favolaschia claudopus TaxID=2862362 RepID=A0AAW0D1P7_9AGAR
MLTPNPRIVFAKRVPADSLPIPGEHLIHDPTPTIDLDAVPLRGGYLTKTLMIAPEPFLRERMRERHVDSYSMHFVLGAPVVGFALVVVLRSEKEGINVGDHLYGMTHWEAYTVQPYIEGRADLKSGNYPDWTIDLEAGGMSAVPDPKGAYPWSLYLGILGGPGLTAYCGLEAYGDAKAGETIYVSSGAGTVGSVVIQLAKHRGLRVIASAGSDAKVEYMRSLGADVAFNYKTHPVSKTLKEHGPLDIYWDNVGGESVEAAIENARTRARFIMCGTLSEYNTPPDECYGVKNTGKIFKKLLQIRGLFVGDLIPTYAGKFYAEMPQLMAQGKMVWKEVVSEGLESAPEALRALLQSGGGDDLGKPIIVVAKE